jgi:hypothetical protein
MLKYFYVKHTYRIKTFSAHCYYFQKLMQTAILTAFILFHLIKINTYPRSDIILNIIMQY